VLIIGGIGLFLNITSAIVVGHGECSSPAFDQHLIVHLRPHVDHGGHSHGGHSHGSNTAALAVVEDPATKELKDSVVSEAL